jgi:uncharacterized iron-regulated membrane protein
MSGRSMRRLWFQLHKWIGLLLAALIIPISVSGAVLVWHEELEPWLHPERFAVSDARATDPAAYVAAARGVLGADARIASLALPRNGHAAVVTAVGAPASGPPVRTSVYLDPPTARVLATARSNEGALRVLHVLHGSLYVPGWGRPLVGWIGVAMMVSAFTGLWLWWPAMGRWTRGLRWARRREFDANLHHQFGFWIALPLFVLSLTGAWISFPQFFGRLTGEARPAGGGGGGGGRPQPIAPRLDVAAVLARAGDARVTQVTWPTDRKPAWTLRTGGGQIAVDDRTAVAKPEPVPPAGIARLMRRIHDGTETPLAWRIVIFLGGLLPAVLAVTGVTLWWRARGRRIELRRRRMAAA